MYRVEYKCINEILANYAVIGKPNQPDFVYECILFDGEKPTALAVKTDVPSIFSGKQVLKHLIRCYIIKDDKINLENFLKIIERYR